MKYTLLFVALLAVIEVVSYCSYTTVSADGITNVTCKDKNEGPYCVNNSLVNITGSDFGEKHFALTVSISSEGKINVNVIDYYFFTEFYICGDLLYNISALADGAHRINVTSKKNPKVMYEATIMIGAFYGIDVPNFITSPPPTDVNVTGQMYNTITKGCNFTATGVFDESKEYEILFYTTNSTYPLTDVPTCGEVTVTKNSLTCIVTKAVTNSEYTYRFLIREKVSGIYLHATQILSSFTAAEFSESCAPYPSPDLPTLPYVTDATGECASESNKCTNGATLTFAGGAFDKDKVSKQVVIEGANGAVCNVNSITETSLTCTLEGLNKGIKGRAPMKLPTNMSYLKVNDVTIRLGALVLGAGAAKGYSMDYESGYTVMTSTSSHMKTVTTALTIVFALLFAIALASLIFVSCKYKMIPRKVWYSITSQLSVTNANNISSNRNVTNNNNDNSEPVHN